MAESILNYLWQAVSASLIQILILFGPGLVLTLILNYETGFVQSRAILAMGRGWYLGLLGWLGTIVHELGHAIFCIIFAHKITEIKLFDPDPETGTLGYVKHAYNPRNIFQLAGNFFIGTGPIVLGAAVIYLLAYGLLGLNALDSSSSFAAESSQLNSWGAWGEFGMRLWNASGQLLAEIFSGEHLASWQLYVFIYLAFAIGSSITLSPPDIKSAAGGFLVIAILILILNLATAWAGNPISNLVMKVGGLYAWFYALALIIFVINALVALMVLMPLGLLRGRRAEAG